MPRTYHFDPLDIEYIRNNWKNKSDGEIANKLNLKLCTVETLRRSMRLLRPRVASKKIDPNILADMCTMFANGFMISQIAVKYNLANATISNHISRYWFKKMESENTKVIVLQSKINQDETTGNKPIKGKAGV